MRSIISFLLFFVFLFFTGIVCIAGDNTLSFGLPPFANPVSLKQKFTPLVQYLSKAVGRPIKVSIAPNYISHVMRLGEGTIDIAFVGPSPYVKTKDKFGGIELLAKFQMQDNINDQVVIFTTKESGIRTLVDLSGKTFAFGDYQSFGSHFMPRYILNNHDISLGDLTAYDYVGSHDNVVLSVQHGDFDAGGVRYDIFKKYHDRPLQIIYGPVPIPPHVLICRASLPDEIKSGLRQALLSLSDQNIFRSINPMMTGFAPVDDQEFSLARKVIDLIESR